MTEGQIVRRDINRFRNALEDIRADKGLSRETVAQRAGISLSAYRQTECLLKCVSAERIKRVAKALEVDPAWLAEQAGYPVRKG
jgi:transcriptional regulator with XRE-family HTH domain